MGKNTFLVNTRGETCRGTAACTSRGKPDMFEAVPCVSFSLTGQVQGIVMWAWDKTQPAGLDHISNTQFSGTPESCAFWGLHVPHTMTTKILVSHGHSSKLVVGCIFLAVV